jgi:hypothetical protein
MPPPPAEITTLNSARKQYPRPAIRRHHGSNHLSPHRPRLPTPPHPQRDRHLIAARPVTTSKIGNSPGHPLGAYQQKCPTFHQEH